MEPSNIKELTKDLPEGFCHAIVQLEQGVRDNLFTAWSCCGNGFMASSYNLDEYNPAGVWPEIGQKQRFLHPYFDLSSLTKPLFLNLWLRHHLKHDYTKFIESNILSHFSSKNIPNISNIIPSIIIDFLTKNPGLTWDCLISHKSGFHPWTWMGKCTWDHETKSNRENGLLEIKLQSKNNSYQEKVIENILNLIFSKFNNEKKGNYSDLNYIFISILISIVFNQDDFSSKINFLNKKNNSNFFHSSINPEKSKYSIPYYPYIINFHDMSDENEFEKFGHVNDLNANIFSRSLNPTKNFVSGHAGLFGNIVDVEKAVLQTQNFYNDSSHFKFDHRFYNGLDRPSGKDSLAGLNNYEKYKDFIFGHLGFTGTSFWFSNYPELSKYNDKVILLTNRTSHRAILGPYQCPRIFVLTDSNSGETKTYVIEKNQISDISVSEAFDLLEESYNLIHKIWDKDYTQTYPNLSDLRRSIGKSILAL